MREKSKTLRQKQEPATQNPEIVSLGPDFSASGSFLFLKSGYTTAGEFFRTPIFILISFSKVFSITLFAFSSLWLSVTCGLYVKVESVLSLFQLGQDNRCHILLLVER